MQPVEASTSRPAGKLIVMGRVVAPFGIRGWLKVQPYTERPETLLQHPTWWLGREDGDDWQPMRLEEGAVHGGNLVVAKLDGLDTPESAARLKQRQVAVPREALPAAKEEEFYWADLIGLDVVNQAGEALGRVDSLMDSGAQCVLVIQGEREHLIPLVDRYVLGVDLPGGRISVDWDADF